MSEVVFVLGMGRSGTSAITRTLSLCGGTLPEQLIPANYGNPTGYWEPAHAIELNSLYLAEHGSSWFDPTLRNWGASDIASDAGEAFVAAIAKFLDSAPYGPLIVKEPRISALSAFWFAAAARAGKQVKCVVCIRDARDVAASLFRRDAMPATIADVLWLKYTLSAERASRSMPRVFVNYDAFMENWRGEVDRIRCELAIDVSRGEPQAVDDFLSPRPRDEALDVRRETLPWVDAVYDRLCRSAAGAKVDTMFLDAAFDAFRSAQGIPLRTPSAAERALADWDTKANWEEAAIRIAIALRSQ